MSKTPEVKVMTMDALNDKIVKGEAFQLLNVLDPQYYGLGVIKGSIMIPLAELKASLAARALLAAAGRLK